MSDERERRVMQDEEAIEKVREICLKRRGAYSNNNAIVCGIVEEELSYDHSVKCEKFYRTKIKVERLSENTDIIPILISEIMLKNISKESIKGKKVKAVGQFRSYSKREKDHTSHLKLFLFATEFEIQDSVTDESFDMNMIFLDGYLCEKPILRKTYKGRVITDLLIAVNREYNKSDYIPCIAWGRIAKWLTKFEVGDRFQLYGRIQSREYLKTTVFENEEEISELKTAYEVSIRRIQNKQDNNPEEI